LKKKGLFIISLLLIFIQISAQKVQFSQFYAAPLVLSPSYTGMTTGSRVVINYRDQWPSIPGTFTTYAASYDQYFPKMKSGIGLLVVRDQAGSGNLNLTDIGLLYSYDITLNRYWHVRPGIKFEYGQRGVDFEKLVFGDQLNIDAAPSTSSLEGKPLTKVGYIDVDASVVAYSSQYWVGFSAEQLLRPNQSFYEYDSRLSIKYVLHGGYKMPIHRKRMKSKHEAESVTFSMLYQNEDMHDQLDLGAYWHKVPFTLGLWFRGIPVIGRQTGYESIDAVIVLVGYEIYDLKFGYSYDYTLSKLIGITGGSHEISLIYEFNKNLELKRKNRQVTIPCPNF